MVDHMLNNMVFILWPTVVENAANKIYTADGFLCLECGQ